MRFVGPGGLTRGPGSGSDREDPQPPLPQTTPESWKITWLTLLFVNTDGLKTKVNRQPVIWGLLAITAGSRTLT